MVQTHTLDKPFIFDSLKNYFQRAGVRVYAAAHPMFTVRRQWEKVVSFGGVQDEGSRESYTFFQIEALESRDRLRRMEHEIVSMLKAVFLAVDDFGDMQRSVREQLGRIHSPRGDAAQLASASAFLEWLLEDNYIFMGTVSYKVGRDGRASRVDESANGAFADPTILPIVFPGVAEHVETHMQPKSGDGRIIDLNFCTGRHHLPP